MVQAVANTTSDTASLFRDDADRLGITPLSALAGHARLRAPNAIHAENDEEEELSLDDPRNNSDRAILARKSGQVRTDATSTQGVMNLSDDSGNGSNATTERIAMQRAAAAAVSTTPSWLRDPIGSAISTVGGWASDAYEWGSNLVENVGERISQTYQTYIATPFSNYIAQPFMENIGRPVANAFNDYVATPFSTHVAEPFMENVGRPVANTFNEYVGTPVSNLASSAMERGSQAVASVKNFFGFGGKEEEKPAQPAETQVARTAEPEERPAAQTQALAGESHNPSTSFSLSGAFSGAVDGVSNFLGFGTPAPQPTATPAMRR